MDLGKDDVSIERLEVDTSGSHVEVEGTITQFDAPVADLATKASVDAMRVATVAKLEERLNRFPSAPAAHCCKRTRTR